MPDIDESFLSAWKVQETAEYLTARQYTRATLQFPDHFLGDAARVAVSVQQCCKHLGHEIQAYILADTTYNSLSVDEVAAAHIDADCVVHYGRASLTPLSRIPAFFVFPILHLDVARTAATLATLPLDPGEGPILCFLDQPYLHQRAELENELAQQLARRCGDAPALLQLQLTRSALPWWALDPTTQELVQGLPLEVRRLLRRRYALVERARDASIVGVLVGTLGVAGYMGAIGQVCDAAEAAGKKTYTLLMGKPSPAKLANFPEIEVFVLVADPQGQILDSKEYLAPIITHHEAMLAFSPDSQWDEARYRLDFGTPAPAAPAGQGEEEGDVPQALALRAARGLQLSQVDEAGARALTPASAADYLVHKRTWTGVEAPLAGAAPALPKAAVPGRSGRAAGYHGDRGEPSGAA